MVDPGGYTEVVILTISHGLAVSGEAVTLNATYPPGINVLFSPSSPVQVPASAPLNVTLTLTASAIAPLGNDTITVHGFAGSYSQTSTFMLRVVQYHVIMIHNAFSPAVLNVTAGSTVYWQNLDGPAGGCGGSSTGAGAHSVVFTTIPGANSSAINQFGIYSYTFTTPGSYFYYSSLNSDHSMNGTINVLGPNGAGVGAAAAMPVFSYFKGGSPAITPTIPTTAGADDPINTVAGPSPLAAGGSALPGTFVLGAHFPTFSALASEAGPIVLIGLIVSCGALIILALAKRSLTTLSTGLKPVASFLRARREATQRPATPSP